MLARASYNGDCAIRLPYLADIEWKIIYVGSAESEEHDQVLSMSLLSFFPTRRDNPFPHSFMCVFSLLTRMGNSILCIIPNVPACLSVGHSHSVKHKHIAPAGLSWHALILTHTHTHTHTQTGSRLDPGWACPGRPEQVCV